MPTLFIFGLGYSATVLAARLRSEGWEVHSTGRAGTMSFDDGGSVRLALANSTHILSSVPPLVGGDPVLQTYGGAGQAISPQPGCTGTHRARGSMKAHRFGGGAKAAIRQTGIGRH
jgi:hypothetical protein